MHVATLFFLFVCSPDTDALSLYTRWHTSPSPQVRIQAVRALRGLAGPKFGSAARAALYRSLSDDHIAVRTAARDELMRRLPAEQDAALAEVAKLRSGRARHEAARALLDRGAPPTAFLREAYLRDNDPRTRVRALATGRLKAADVPLSLWRSDPVTRAWAIDVVGDATAAARWARDAAEPVRIAAARTSDSPDLWRRLLRDKSWRVQLATLIRCEAARRAEAVGEIIAAMPRLRGRVLVQAAKSLAAMTCIDFGPDPIRWRTWWNAQADGYSLPPARRRIASGHKTAAALRFRRLPVDSLRVCFVLDGSRSMNESAQRRGSNAQTRWALVVQDLEAVLNRLSKQARFNVIVFQTGVIPWKRRLVRNTPGNRNACGRWIAEVQPSGWTNLFDALEVALSDDDVDALYVLTDGVPSRGAETTRTGILSEIEILNRFRLVQINCVQVGSTDGLGKRWRGFLDDLAKSNDGRAVRD